MKFRRSVDEVVETFRTAKQREKKCTLLVGAGCSVKAGVPTAAGFVKTIEERWPWAYQRATAKTYPKCMGELAVAERRDLIAKFIDGARINWAHICIAQLMKTGYVDRVLTTNFDLLVVRACALLGVYPAIYDFAASQLYDADAIPDQAVFYLHGQRTGFVLMNTEGECEQHSKFLAPVFVDAGRGRVWMVIGYSGENDPVFNHLAGVRRFDNNLYWVGYKDNEPAVHVRERLLVDGKYAFYTNGFDADDFLVILCQKLGVFPPEFIAKPFTYLDGLLETVTPYTLPGQDAEVDVAEESRALIRSAREQYEEGAEGGTVVHEVQHKRVSAIEAQRLLMKGDYDAVLAMRPEFDAGRAPELADSLTWAYVLLGNTAIDLAGEAVGEDADALFAEAGAKYAAALKIKPDKHEVLDNWGIALSHQAKQKTGEEADRLFAEAGRKYAAALKIKPQSHGALNNWGAALTDQAEQKTGEEADRLFAEAGAKYAAALQIKPDKHEALSNWAVALIEQARQKSGEEADRLFAEAGQKYAAALKIKPQCHEALSNWGVALIEQARQKTGEEADRLSAEAGEKLAAAWTIKPDDHGVLDAWGSALFEQAKQKTGQEADRLLDEAVAKYAAALRVKPDHPEALYNWGNALIVQAKLKSGDQADRLLAEAGEKYGAALKIDPDMHDALSHWGVALHEQAKHKTGEQADRLFAQAGEKHEAALKVKPDSHEVLTNWGNALALQAKQKTDDEADRLFAEAGGKYTAALKVKPDCHQALFNWGTALLTQGTQKTGPEAQRLFAEAAEKSEAALKIKPDMREALSNWGSALLHQVRFASGGDAASLLTQAREKTLAAEKLEPGSGAYNLACINAREGSENGCRKWLQATRDAGKLPPRDDIEKDPDLESVRGCEWFKEFLHEL